MDLAKTIIHAMRPYSDEELQSLTDEEFADLYFEQSDIDPEGSLIETGLVEKELKRRGKTPGDLLIGR